MKVRICPLCDSEMKKLHYCDTCNSFIWHPEMLDIHYNSDSRGMGEVDCAYGDSHDYYDHHADKRADKKALDRNRIGNKTTGTAKTSDSHQEVFGSSMSRKTSGSKNKRGIISKIIAIVIGLNIIGGLLDFAVDAIATDSFENIIDSFFDSAGIDINFDQDSDDDKMYPASEVNDDAFSDNYMEISDEELAYYSDGCNGYDHFDLTSDELLPQMVELIEDWYGSGYAADPYTDIDNYRYVYGDGVEYVYLETAVTYQLGDDDGYIRVGYDTVTKKIHSVTVSWLPPGKTELIFKEIAAMLLDGVTEAEIEDGADLLFGDGRTDYNRGVCGELIVYITDNDDGTMWMDISPAW